jgi:ribose transport system ATP-binding protein
MQNIESVVNMIGINKHFHGVYALKNVNFSTRRGEVHALVGENGAGKSTLMKILAGLFRMDSGEVWVNGQKRQFSSPKDGMDAGISIIYQEFSLAQQLTVAENIMIDNLAGGKHVIDWKKLYATAQSILERLGFGQIDVKEKINNLSVAYQQVVEIAKALSRKADVMVLDEPTAALASKEEQQLFDTILKLKEQGVCIIYISHRLNEIFMLSDRITVLKDGENVATMDTKDINEEQLVTFMIGRKLSEIFPIRYSDVGEAILRVENLECGSNVNDVSFEVRKGEILGINGLVGAGRTETIRAIFGADKKTGGRVYLDGNEVQITSSEHAVKYGIGLLSEDRKRNGVLLNQSIRVNVTITILKTLANRIGAINRVKEDAVLGGIVAKLQIKTAGLENFVSSLSGGNQQKVALSKWLVSNCRVLILDEPTRGVDVGAKVEIYKIMNNLAEEGISIIMVSSEMTEIIGMSDRVIVMREGKIMGELTSEAINEENLIKMSMGV